MNGVLVMTALVPTVGHQFLIDFAISFMRGDPLTILVCGRPQEPISIYSRSSAIREYVYANYGDDCDVNVTFMLNDPPQNPEDHPDFWQIWAGYAVEYSSYSKIDFLFASEKYGIEYAKVLGAKFVPCDIDREVFPVKGTDVRQDIRGKWDLVLPQFKKYLRKTVTFFGAESTGKTTMSKRIASHFGGTWMPEWARPYLTAVGPDIDEGVMDTITQGQFAMQKAVEANPKTSHLIVRDTDLFSTYGYYQIYSRPTHKVKLFSLVSSANLYVVMNSKIPFTPDVLRYGGDVRESDDSHWINILNKFKLNRVVVESTDPEEQFEEVKAAVEKLTSFEEISGFVRD